MIAAVALSSPDISPSGTGAAPGRNLTQTITVMYCGQTVESGRTKQIFKQPFHPYTMALISAVPSPETGLAGSERIRLQGDPPSPIAPPPGCRFAGRCTFATDHCRKVAPVLTATGGNHAVACHRAQDAEVAAARNALVQGAPSG